VNGLKVAVLDMKPEWWRYQKKANQIVQLVFGVLFIPMAVKMLVSVLAHLGEEK
jgi:threonine/homoserine/homoserine lactone efflux protein